MISDRNGARNGDWDGTLDDALGAPVPAPDLTRSIMGRLGYMPVAPAVARRRRVRRAAGRLAALAAAVLGFVLAFHVRDGTDLVRRPVGPTLPAAIGHDVSFQQDRLHRALQTIERWAPGLQLPATPARDEPEGRPDDVVERAVGPVC